MSLTAADKAKIVKTYQQSKNDTGSSDVQIALLSARISALTEHLKIHKHDFHTRYGLTNLVSQRRRLMRYLKGQDLARYRQQTELLICIISSIDFYFLFRQYSVTKKLKRRFNTVRINLPRDRHYHARQAKTCSIVTTDDTVVLVTVVGDDSAPLTRIFSLLLLTTKNVLMRPAAYQVVIQTRRQTKRKRNADLTLN